MNVLDAISNVVSYNWADEERDFNDNPPDPEHEAGHIFSSLKVLNEAFAVGYEEDEEIDGSMAKEDRRNGR